MKYKSEVFLKLKEKALPLSTVLEDMAQCAGYEVEVGEDGSVEIPIGALEESAAAESATGSALEEEKKIFGILEKTARVILAAERIGGAIPLDRKIVEEERRFYIEDYSKRGRTPKNGRDPNETASGIEPLYEAEGEVLSDMGRRLLEKGYVRGTWGNLSVRIGINTMLVTPSGRNYGDLESGDMIPVDIETGEAKEEVKRSGRPTSEKDLHRLIYMSFPEVKAIIHTHSVGSSVYAAARKPMEFSGGTIPVAEFAPAGTMELADNVVMAMKEHYTMPGSDSREGNLACLLANHGLVVCGKDMERAFSFCGEIEDVGERSLYD